MWEYVPGLFANAATVEIVNITSMNDVLCIWMITPMAFRKLPYTLYCENCSLY